MSESTRPVEPKLQIDVNAYGEIERVYGDLRLLAPLVERVSAPTIEAILAHTETANILPSGEHARMQGPIDNEPIVWFLDCMDLSAETYYQLRTRGREITIHIRVSKAADRSSLKNEDVLVNFQCDRQLLFEETLNAVRKEPDLTECLINLADNVDEWAYTGCTEEVVGALSAFRHQRAQLFTLLKRTPAPDAERHE